MEGWERWWIAAIVFYAATITAPEDKEFPPLIFSLICMALVIVHIFFG